MKRTTSSTTRPVARTAAAMPRSPLPALLLGALCLGLVAIASLPAARGHSAAIGWVPLWLVGMPMVALAVATLLGRTGGVEARSTASPLAAARWQSGPLAAARRRPSRDPARRPSLPRAA